MNDVTDKDCNYINCPKCNARIFEKNLCRHMNSNRCKKNSNQFSSVQETNRSMLNKLVVENKQLKDAVELSKHENECAEKLFLRLMGSLKNDKLKQEIDGLNFKHDQCTQTDEHVHHIDF